MTRLVVPSICHCGQNRSDVEGKRGQICGPAKHAMGRKQGKLTPRGSRKPPLKLFPCNELCTQTGQRFRHIIMNMKLYRESPPPLLQSLNSWREYKVYRESLSLRSSLPLLPQRRKKKFLLYTHVHVGQSLHIIPQRPAWKEQVSRLKHLQ